MTQTSGERAPEIPRPPTRPMPVGDIDTLCINTMRTLAMDAVETASSGHPGAPMGAAPMAYALWTGFLKHDPSDPGWMDRDRFVLSPGHASMLLYSLLHLTGYGLTLDELKSFRSWESRTPGHPEHGLTPGVETTTGPLGQGFATGVGMAMAERFLADRFNRPGYEVVNHHVYGIVSDGDLMEGISSEAASLAGHLRLGKIVYLYDSNGISIDGPTDLAFTEKVGQRFLAYGWHVESVRDGNDLDAIRNAVSRARENDRPSLISVRTHIGYGAPHKQDTAEVHGAPLGEDELRAAKAGLGWPETAHFLVPTEVRARMEVSTAMGRSERKSWLAMLARYDDAYPHEGSEFRRLLRGALPDAWDGDLPVFSARDSVPTRKASGIVLNALAERIPELVGGSADLTESNNTEISSGGSFGPGVSGRNIRFGVREHAMGAALNGMALHGGVRPFGGTFLVFSDYMRPAVRLASLMGTPVIFVFTHDSVGLGADGPTHQPVEHLASLRAMPNLVVLRPADANETAQALRVAVSYKEGPVALCLSRQALPVLESTARSRPPVELGAYVVSEHGGQPDLILIGTGSEVHVCLEAAHLLKADGVVARVVSMPSWELFARQPHRYREEVLPAAVPLRIAVEAGSPLGWSTWVGSSGVVVGLDRFGASAPGGVVLDKLGLTSKAVAERALGLFYVRGHQTR